MDHDVEQPEDGMELSEHDYELTDELADESTSQDEGDLLN